MTNSSESYLLESGVRVINFKSLESTQDEALKFISENTLEAPGLVIRADHQTKGKGRRGKEWVSPNGDGLYFTLALETETDVASLSGLSIVAGMAAHSAITEFMSDDKKEFLKLKWPNDLLFIDGDSPAKLGGILTDISSFNTKNRLLIGTGINLLGEVKLENRLTTSLESLGVNSSQFENLFSRIVSNQVNFFSKLVKEGFGEFADRWAFSGVGYEGPISVVSMNGESLNGRASALNRDGALKLLTDSGETILVYSSEIELA